MDKSQLRKALDALDKKISSPISLVMGGGGAMILAYNHPSSTTDIDVIPVPFQLLSDLEKIITDIAHEMSIPSDWLNTHFAEFTYVVPEDFSSRLRPLIKGTFLTVDIFGPEDMIILKCMAGRNKDRTHLRKLFREKNVDLKFVEEHLQKLMSDGIERAKHAIELFEELRDELVD